MLHTKGALDGIKGVFGKLGSKRAKAPDKESPKDLDEKAEFSVELTKKMGELGLFGMYIPEEYGGQGVDTLSYIIN